MRPMKSAGELATLIMREVRNQPDWSDVESVSVLPNIGAAPNEPNWKSAFGMKEARPVPADALSLATALSQRFDWDEKP
jgi:hypothetical protein